MTDVDGYTFYFGTFRSRGGRLGKMEPWELKHVDNITSSITCATSTVGVPNRPADGAQVFNMQGPVRNINVEFTRYDAEEDISNIDFIFNERNVCSDGATRIGLMYLNSHMQVSLEGYLFQSIPKSTGEEGLFGSRLYRVALNGFSVDADETNPGVIHVSLNLIERRRSGNGNY